MSLDRHEGPWPSTGTLDCDWCGKEVARTDPWSSWWNPFRSYGWTFVCGDCDTAARAAINAIALVGLPPSEAEIRAATEAIDAVGLRSKREIEGS